MLIKLLALFGFGRSIALEATETGFTTPHPVQAGEWEFRHLGGDAMVIAPMGITIGEGEDLAQTIICHMGRPVLVAAMMGPAAEWTEVSLHSFDASGTLLAATESLTGEDLNGHDVVVFETHGNAPTLPRPPAAPPCEPLHPGGPKRRR